MLQVEKLVKNYKTGFLGKEVTVLKGVSFSVEDGEIFGFVGPNGAGKTTTFKSILGFVNFTEGKITIMDRPSRDVSVREGIGYLPENPYFYDYLTGEELLFYMGELHGINRRELRSRIDQLLERVSMEHARKTQLRKYSKGMLQRIGIAQALINDPQFIILDEPMSGLDPIGRREIRELIIEEKRKGKTILLSSHMLADIEALCDRVAVIMKGVVVKTGHIGELLKNIETDYEMLVESGYEIRDKVKELSIEIEKRAGYLVLRFDEDMKNRVLGKVAETGANIVSLHPMRKSLEELFVEEAGKNIS